MRRTLFYILLILVFSSISCKKGHELDCFHGTGEITTVSIPLEFFNKVDANGRISVLFTQDGQNKIDITCGEKLLKGITYRIADSVLYLDNENKCNWVRRFDAIPEITVHYTDLNYFKANNYYDNYFISRHNGDSIKMEYWVGSGCTHFYGNVNYAEFYVHAGGGSFTATGQANNSLIYHASRTQIDFSGFNSKMLEVNTKSNNNIRVHCDSALIVSIHYSGNVYYSGNPVKIYQYGHGSGQLIKE